jgi:CRISPR-associated endonuclease/helicase Cas3
MPGLPQLHHGQNSQASVHSDSCLMGTDCFRRLQMIEDYDDRSPIGSQLSTVRRPPYRHSVTSSVGSVTSGQLGTHLVVEGVDTCPPCGIVSRSEASQYEGGFVMVPTSRADEFFAHSLPGHPQEDWHRLEDHLRSTADLARRFAEPFAAGGWAFLAGLWHDLGKYSEDFQHRLEGDPRAVDHSTFGAQWADKQIHQAGRLLAYVIAGHHSGLPDGSAVGRSCLRDRLVKSVAALKSVPQRMLDGSSDLAAPGWLQQGSYRFQLAFFTRMLFSCLVDADFLDTEAFFRPQDVSGRGVFPDLERMYRRLSKTLADLCSSASPTVVNQARRHVLKECLRAANLAPGFFSLTVPTGGGKTYASLAFALRHALEHGLSRVIYALPFTTIIEQNARAFREALGDCAGAVVEHHGNLILNDMDAMTKLAIENWDANLIVTTNVQFFESLYSNRVSACRKLHNLARAVIILDEAQALPVSVLAPCLEALRELVRGYGATVVLCTATQPALERREDFAFGLEGVREIIPDPEALANELKRVEVQLIGRRTVEGLATALREHARSLCVVNTRREARELFNLVGDEDGAFHLSALMCPAHRSNVLGAIRQRLGDSSAPCRVVSTQLVEAGVDVDFPVVFRAMAGLDSIAQAAGRCNREGHLTRGMVYVFDGDRPPPAGFLRQTAQAASLILPQFRTNLLGLDAVRAYFERHYWVQQGNMDTLEVLRRLNEFAMDDLWIPFEAVGRDFRIIRDEGLSVLVPYDNSARDHIASLRRDGFTPTIARKLQRYAVQVYPRDFELLCAAGALELIGERCAILIREDAYDNRTGLLQDVSQVYDPETLYSD